MIPVGRVPSSRNISKVQTLVTYFEIRNFLCPELVKLNEIYLKNISTNLTYGSLKAETVALTYMQLKKAQAI